MANPTWFDEQYYLTSKLGQLRAAGLTEYTSTAQVRRAIDEAGFESIFDHYTAYSLQEQTSPNATFNTYEYLEAKVRSLNAAAEGGRTDWDAQDVINAFKNAGFETALDHYNTVGWAEGLNPSNAFDTAAYFNEKLAQLQAEDPATYGDWTVEQVQDAFTAAGLSPITHYYSVGEKEGLSPVEVPAAEKVKADPNVYDPIDNPGQTFTLTTGVDNLQGTSGDDTFIGGSAEIQAADVINGLAGTDTAKLYLDGAGGTARSLNSSNVEVFKIQASGTDTFNASNVVGAQQIWSSGSTAALTVANIQNNLTLGLENTNADLTVSFKAAVIGSTETLAFAADTAGISTDRVVVVVNDGGASSKFTTLDVNAVAGKSFITIDTGATNATTDFTTIKTSGAGTVNLTDASAVGAVEPFANVTTVDLQATGGSTVDLARSVNAQNVTVKAGDGNDRIEFAATQFNTSDSVDLGGGTNTLVVGDAGLAQAATVDLIKAINAAKGVTTLGTTALADVTINAGRYTSIDSFAVLGNGATANGVVGTAATNAGVDGSAAVAVTGVAASGDSLQLQDDLTGGAATAGANANVDAGAGGAGLSVRMATDGGTDTFSLSVAENAVVINGGKGVAIGGGKSAGAAGVGIDAREVETLNIAVSKNLTVDAGAANGGTQATADVLVGGNATLNISGTGNVDLGSVKANSNDTAFQNLNIKAGDLVGTLTVVTDAGNDTIIVGSKGSDVTAGVGLDTITLGAGVDTVRFAGGDSGVVTTGVIGRIDVINGFTAGSGGDVIDENTGARTFTQITTANQTTISNAANLTDAIDAALGFVAATTWGAFSYGGKTYAVYDAVDGAGFVNGADIVIEVAGVVATDLVAANFS